MKKTCLCAVAALCSVFLISNSAIAQGTAFTYQGKLNSGTNLANGLYDFRFKLYADPVGTTQVGSSYLTNAVPASNGLFTVAMDFGAVFNGSNRWLEVDVKTNLAASYMVLSPLQAVTPAPYAIMAASASNLTGNLPAAQLSGPVLSGQRPPAKPEA